MLKTYIVTVKYVHFESYKIVAHSEEEALITYDEGVLVSSTEPVLALTGSCKIRRVKS